MRKRRLRRISVGDVLNDVQRFPRIIEPRAEVDIVLGPGQ